MLKLYNPFNDETSSFPEMAYGRRFIIYRQVLLTKFNMNADAAINNNCRAMLMALSEYAVLCDYNKLPPVESSGFNGTEDVFEQEDSSIDVDEQKHTASL
jgi:hypothetical protein